MKKRLISNSLKQLFLAVPASALMLGASQAQTTVGLNFQAYYYGAGTTNAQVIGYGKGYQTTGFPVTATAFGLPVGDWTSTGPFDAHFAAISTNADFGDGLTAEITAPAAWQSGIGELISGWNPETVPPGNDEVTWGYLSDGTTVGVAAGESPSVSVSGLAAKFPHGYVIQTIAAANGAVTFAPVDITDGTNDSQVAYSTYYVASAASDGYDSGGTVGLSAPSAAFTSDTISIDCDTNSTSDRSTLAGFIITDQPAVTYYAPTATVVAPGDSFVLSANAIGLGNLTYQWQHAGTNLPGATFPNYTNTAAALTDGGAYQLIATSDTFPSNPGASPALLVTVHSPQTNTWDANTNTAGTHPLDGSGTWSPAGTNWWTGMLDTNLFPNDTGVFGAGGMGPYTVAISNAVTVNALTFDSGDYTITNTSGETLTLQGAAEITANAQAAITAPLSTGTNTFTKAGAGALTIASGGLTCGQTTVNAGTLQVLAKNGDAPYIITNGATLQLGYSTGGGYANTAMQIYGSGASSAAGLYLAGGTTYNVSGTLTLEDAPTTIRQFGSGPASIGIFDINDTGLWCTAAASGSVIDTNVQLVSDGYGMSVQADPGADTATGDLINGPLSISTQNGIYGLVKRGTGSVLLNAPATLINCDLEILAGSVICGTEGCIGTNSSLEISAGATLYFNGTSQTVFNVLDPRAMTPGLAGTLSMSINKGGTPSSTVLTEADGGQMALGGTLVVTNLGGALVLGDTFTLFNSIGGFTGKFASLKLPVLADGLGWSNNFAVDGATNGTIEVVPGGGPNIDTDLSDTTNYAYVGGGVTYSVVADGDPTLQYQWLQNGTTPVGTNGPTLTLTSVTLASAGYYSVIITNAYGSAHSKSNYLDVVPTSGYAALVASSDPLSFWPLDETSGTTAFDYWSGYNAAYTGGFDLAAAPNPVTGTTAAYFDGSDGYALTPYYPGLNPPVFSAEAWVNPSAAPSSEFCVLSCGQFATSGRSGWLIYQFPTYWNLRTYYANGTATAVSLNGVSVPVLNAWTHLAVTWDGTTARLYVNGTLEGSQVPTTTPNYVPGVSGGFCVGARADVSFYWGGYVSDAALYSHVLTPQEISAHAQNQPLLAIAPTTNGPAKDIVLSWTGSGTVQASTTLTGTYTNVPGATSPWTNTPSGQSMFYRLKF